MGLDRGGATSGTKGGTRKGIELNSIIRYLNTVKFIRSIYIYM